MNRAGDGRPARARAVQRLSRTSTSERRGGKQHDPTHPATASIG
ncbi:hypothetical protein OH687_03740 [Burkholderia anthina]|nr:hypothetical protein OH687_03740 [Burkholderia anthina]